MKDNPTPHPEIEVIKRPSGIQSAWHFSGRSGDYIYFQSCKNASEEDIISLLNHELDHWAQTIYLDDKEVDKKSFEYFISLQRNEVPFVEYAVAFRGNYNYEAWERKYQKKKSLNTRKAVW